MTDIKIEAFLDLEAALTDRLGRAWVRHFKPTGKAIEDAVRAQDFDKAYEAVEKIDAAPVIDKNWKYVSTMGMASVLLGVARLSKLEDSEVYKDLPKDVVIRSTDQMKQIYATGMTTMVKNVALKLIAQRHKEILEKIEKAEPVSDSVFAREVKKRLKKTGKEFVAMSASLHVSRMSSYGFMLEAMKQQVTTYTIDAVLDSRTCPVCSYLDGKTFSVQSAYSTMSQILSSDNPDDIKHIHPFPSQSKAGVERMESLSNDELQQNGYGFPPFHPGCRCICNSSTHEIEGVPSNREVIREHVWSTEDWKDLSTRPAVVVQVGPQAGLTQDGIQSFKVLASEDDWKDWRDPWEEQTISLSEDDLNALAKYKNDYENMNSALRSYEAYPKETSKDAFLEDFWGGLSKDFNSLDAVLRKTQVPEAITTYRGVKNPYLTFRVEELSELVGQTYKDGAFVSTSLSKVMGERFAGAAGAVIELRVPKGVSGYYYNAMKLLDIPLDYADEYELLLNHGTEFKVLKVVEPEKGPAKIIVEVVPSGVNPDTIPILKSWWSRIFKSKKKDRARRFTWEVGDLVKVS